MLSQDILRSVPQLIRVIRHLSTTQLEDAITLHHLRILILVSEGQGQSQMADTLQISLPAVSKMVNGLVQRRLVKRTPGKDRRCLTLKLTSRGKKTVRIVSQGVEKKIEMALSEFSPGECQELEKGLKVIDKLVLTLKRIQ